MSVAVGDACEAFIHQLLTQVAKETHIQSDMSDLDESDDNYAFNVDQRLKDIAWIQYRVRPLIEACQEYLKVL